MPVHFLSHLLFLPDPVGCHSAALSVTSQATNALPVLALPPVRSAIGVPALTC